MTNVADTMAGASAHSADDGPAVVGTAATKEETFVSVVVAGQDRSQTCANKTGAVLARQEERQAELQRKKVHRQGHDDPAESAQLFFTEFRTLRQGLAHKLGTAEALTAKPQLVALFDALDKDVVGLQKYLNDSARFLPSYDIRQSQTHVNTLRTDITAAQGRLIPKKKFAFKSRKQKKAKAVAVVAEVASAVTVQTLTDASQVSLNKAGWEGLSNQTLVMKAADVMGKDLEIKNLTDCTIFIRGQPNILHVKNLTRCKVCIGPISRSLFIADCTDCTFALACQQLRVHDTKGTDFYLHVTSKAIIEDCNTVRFAPYTYSNSQMIVHHCPFLPKRF